MEALEFAGAIMLSYLWATAFVRLLLKVFCMLMEKRPASQTR